MLCGSVYPFPFEGRGWVGTVSWLGLRLCAGGFWVALRKL